jgi:hypothetical protein
LLVICGRSVVFHWYCCVHSYALLSLEPFLALSMWNGHCTSFYQRLCDIPTLWSLFPHQLTLVWLHDLPQITNNLYHIKFFDFTFPQVEIELITLVVIGLVWFMVFMPLSKIFQLYHGDQFYCWRKPEYPEKTIDLPQVTDTL